MSSDGEEMLNAEQGFGTNEEALIKIVANLTNKRRQKRKEQYKTSFHRDLISVLKSELKGKLEKQ